MQKNLEQILKIIIHASDILEEELKQESDLINLTERQLSCVESIMDLKNPSISELASSLKIAKASMSVMIERLENNQYIVKVVSDEDRRTAHIHLTEKGIKAAHLHTELHQRISELLTRDMTESEKEILNVLLNKSVKTLYKNNIEFIKRNKKGEY